MTRAGATDMACLDDSLPAYYGWTRALGRHWCAFGMWIYDWMSAAFAFQGSGKLQAEGMPLSRIWDAILGAKRT